MVSLSLRLSLSFTWTDHCCHIKHIECDLNVRWWLVADDGKQPAKPLSDAAVSRTSSERVASRDTSQSKKTDRQQSSESGGSDDSVFSSALSNTAGTAAAVVNSRRRLADITLELPLLTAVTASLLYIL